MSHGKFILLVSDSLGKEQGIQTWPKKGKEICWSASGKGFLADEERHTGRDVAPSAWEASCMGEVMANRLRTAEQKDG